jgi:hypothetical protein
VALKINSKKNPILQDWAEPMGPTLPAGPASRPAEAHLGPGEGRPATRGRGPRQSAAAVPLGVRTLDAWGHVPIKGQSPTPPRSLTPNAAFAPRRLVAVQRRPAAMPELSIAGRRFDLLMWSTVGASREPPELSRAELEPPH